MTQVSGTFPALSDGVGTKPKPKKRKPARKGARVKAALDNLHRQVKG